MRKIVKKFLVRTEYRCSSARYAVTILGDAFFSDMLMSHRTLFFFFPCSSAVLGEPRPLLLQIS
jgi:hypothetical protein